MRRAISYILLLFVLFSNGVYGQSSDEQVAAYHYDRGEFSEALQFYKSLYKKTESKFYYQRLLATLMELDEYREAERLVESRQRRYNGDLSLYVDLGTVYLRQNKTTKAENQFDKAINAVGTNAQPLNDLAMAFCGANRVDYAVKVYQKAREKSHSNYLFFNELVGLYQRQGNYDAIVDEYFMLLDEQPGMMRTVQVSFQRALLDDPNGRLAEGFRRGLVERIRRSPDNQVYTEMMLWFSLQQKDFEFALTQAKAIDARFPQQNGDQVFRVAQIAMSNASYDVATDGYNYLVNKGQESSHYYESRLGLLDASYKVFIQHGAIDTTERNLLITRFEATLEELGKSVNTAPLMRKYAHLLAYYVHDIQGALDLLDMVVAMARLDARQRDEAKLELGDVLLFAGQNWDASLLYMQVEKGNKDEVIGSLAKYKNAKLSYFTHDFAWALSQLNVLRASTSKLIANDAMELSLIITGNMDDDSSYTTLEMYADADFLLYRNMLDSAWGLFSMIEARNLHHPILDETMLKKVDILVARKDYLGADSLLNKLLEFYPNEITTDDALMKRADLNERYLGNVRMAMLCYERLLLEYPTSVYINEARERYNVLKPRVVYAE
ncbi:MAG: hypothetical protein IJ761_03405 [Bacteroidales bacterium]|nr:hypothetical protein [Bacteroidales bacterium]